MAQEDLVANAAARRHTKLVYSQVIRRLSHCRPILTKGYHEDPILFRVRQTSNSAHTTHNGIIYDIQKYQIRLCIGNI